MRSGEAGVEREKAVRTESSQDFMLDEKEQEKARRRGGGREGGREGRKKRNLRKLAEYQTINKGLPEQIV